MDAAKELRKENDKLRDNINQISAKLLAEIDKNQALQ